MWEGLKYYFHLITLLFARKILPIICQENIANICNITIIYQANNTNIVSASYHNNVWEALVSPLTDERKEECI